MAPYSIICSENEQSATKLMLPSNRLINSQTTALTDTFPSNCDPSVLCLIKTACKKLHLNLNHYLQTDNVFLFCTVPLCIQLMLLSFSCILSLLIFSAETGYLTQFCLLPVGNIYVWEQRRLQCLKLLQYKAAEESHLENDSHTVDHLVNTITS